MNKEELEYVKENYFKENVSLGLIFEMIDQALNEKINLDQGTVTPDEDISISLPTIRISEAWGRQGNTDRAIIESFTKRIQGATLEQKLASLNNVLSDATPAANISELLSTMMVCEILSVILRDFTESAGGFIFEGFLAGLFGGKSVQITSPEEIEGMDASGKPITDVVLGDRHYSLKLLGPNTAVKGSFQNLVNHFKSIDHVIYLDARRIDGTQGLEFGEFEIKLDNFLDIFFRPFAKIKQNTVVARTSRALSNALEKYGDQVFKVKTSKPVGRRYVFTAEEIQQIDPVALDELRPFTVSYSEERFQGSTKAKYLFGTGRQFNAVVAAIESGDEAQIFAALEDTPGYQKSRQFVLTKNQVEKKIQNFRTIGTLMIGEETMKSVWLKYAKILQEVINPVYSNLQEFTNNVNAYLLGAGDANRKERGVQAINDAKQLSDATSKVVEKVTPDEV